MAHNVPETSPEGLLKVLTSAVIGTNLVLEPGKKCYKAEVWLKHPEICVQYLKKKSHESPLRQPKYLPFCSKWLKFTG